MYSARRGGDHHGVPSPTTVLNDFMAAEQDDTAYRPPFSPAQVTGAYAGGRGRAMNYDSGVTQALQTEHVRRCHETMGRDDSARGVNDDEMSDLIVGGDTATYLDMLSQARAHRPVSARCRSNNRRDPQPPANSFGDLLTEELLAPRSETTTTMELRAQLGLAIKQRDEAEHAAAKATALLKHQAELAQHKLAKAEGERNDAIMQLVVAQEDLHALQAQLEDAALYIASLKRRHSQLEMVALSALHQRDEAAAEAAYYEQGAEAAFEYAARAADSAQSEPSGGDGVFSMTNIQKSIENAVQGMAALPEEEQRKKIKQLRLRWHPDKNPVLGEFAAEVTKLINECVEKLRTSPKPQEEEEKKTATPAAAEPAAAGEEAAPQSSSEKQGGPKGQTLGGGGVLSIRNI